MISRVLKQGLTYAAMLAVVALFIFPFYWLLISAFKTKAQIFTLPPQFFPLPVVVQILWTSSGPLLCLARS